MTTPIFFLVQATTSPPDSVGLSAQSNFYATVEVISGMALAVLVLGVLFALIGVLLQFRKLTRSVTEVTKRLEKEGGPVMERARSVAENMDFITAAVRTDVQKVNKSVAQLNDRLNQASTRMEERIQDFSALVEMLQSEAEELALDTAAAVRGVRAGTKALAEGNGGPVEENKGD
jgi:hypothetical protein